MLEFRGELESIRSTNKFAIRSSLQHICFGIFIVSYLNRGFPKTQQHPQGHRH